VRWAEVVGRAVLAVGLAAGIAGLAGCAKVRSIGCQVDHPVVTPRSVKVGMMLTVTSLGHPCTRMTAPDGTHRLVLSQVGKTNVDLGAVPVQSDGTFSIQARIPTGARPGLAFISVSGALPVPCDDIGSASCSGYVTKVNLEAP
jgi:hypothetical protein